MKGSGRCVQRAQTAAATGSVSKLASRTGLASYSARSRTGGGPPRVLGSQEINEKKIYAQKWNSALVAEAIDAANATKERIGALSPQTLARFEPFLSMFFGVFHACMWWTEMVWLCLALLLSQLVGSSLI